MRRNGYEIRRKKPDHGQGQIGQTGDIMSLVKFDVTGPVEMASVLTTESVSEMKLKVGEEVRLVVKAIHVLPVKD